MQSDFSNFWPKIPFWIPKSSCRANQIVSYYLLLESVSLGGGGWGHWRYGFHYYVSSFLVMNIFKQTKIPIWNQNSFILDYLSQFGVWCPSPWNLIFLQKQAKNSCFYTKNKWTFCVKLGKSGGQFHKNGTVSRKTGQFHAKR